jgi:hypothetical protein
MKKLLFFFTLVISFSANAQWYWQESFEAPNDLYRGKFFRDTNSNHNNIWQIGHPNKTVFTAAYSNPNALVTDTLHPYPTNDTSVVIVKHQKRVSNIFTVDFWYRLDKDSLETARVEVSGDTGHHWVDIMKDDTTYDIFWALPKPNLSAVTSNGWVHIAFDMTDWSHNMGTYPSHITADTFLIRFTFASDNVQTNKDGWMIDNFSVEDYIHEGGISSKYKENLLHLYPNPSGGTFYMSVPAGEEAQNLAIYAMDGSKKMELPHVPASGKIETGLPVGVYFVSCVTNKRTISSKLVITR